MRAVKVRALKIYKAHLEKTQDNPINWRQLKEWYISLTSQQREAIITLKRLKREEKQ